MKKLYEINLQKLKDQIYDGGDYLMLEYLHDYLTDALKEKDFQKEKGYMVLL